MKLIAHTFAAALCAAAMISAPAIAGTEQDVSALQHGWEHVKYQTAPAEQEKAYERLVQEADKTLSEHPRQPEVLIWHGIIEASYAGAKGGFGALNHVKTARKDFEAAIAIKPDALNGSAYTSLGSLYYQVPGWPIGFGDDKKAFEYLGKGLALNPDGIDPNYFYGDFLFRSGDPDKAEKVLRKALQAPPRPGREVADEGRRREIGQLLEKIAQARR